MNITVFYSDIFDKLHYLYDNYNNHKQNYRPACISEFVRKNMDKEISRNQG